MRFNIPAGPLAGALGRWSAQSRGQLLFSRADIGRVRTRGYRGTATPRAALERLLADSGFGMSVDASGAIAIVRRPAPPRSVVEAEAAATTPEILVRGRRDWSLNLGIERTPNDSQPFVVLSAQDIRQSGARDVESFLRDRLSSNTAAATASQAGLDDAQERFLRGLSQVNLRGLGSRETLILVDGRRQPGINLGTGAFGQAQLGHIPTAAIERIEVLASSASSIYGSGASGGVVNIVLRRPREGGEITASYGDTDDLAASRVQLDAVAGHAFEGGRTIVSVAGSWQRMASLRYGDRIAIRNDAVADAIRLTGVHPLVDFGLPPVGQTPNFHSARLGVDGRRAALRLKPAYGGATLGSAIGHIPDGYRGLAVDGVAPLLATIGSYNLAPPAGAGEGGRDAPLMYGTDMVSGLVSARRAMTDRLTLYAQATASRIASTTVASRGFNYIILSAGAPNNPFDESIFLAVPDVGARDPLVNVQTAAGLLGGAIWTLPAGWQANLDIAYARHRHSVGRIPRGVGAEDSAALSAGAIDVFRDLSLDPPTFSYDTRYQTDIGRPRASNLTTSLRLAGPLPVTLPGGAVRLAANAERSLDRLGSIDIALNYFDYYLLLRQATGRYVLWSGYGEMHLPLIAPANAVPFARSFDLRFSLRSERYDATGADQPILCYFNLGPPDPSAIPDCPPPGTDDRIGRSVRSHLDPMASLRWEPVAGLTFRASYGTGYLPPQLSQISKQTGRIEVGLRDPQRGYEAFDSVEAAFGGNPALKPEVSRTLTLGAIATPRAVPGLRLSVDWTRISKRDNFFDPDTLRYAARGYDPARPIEGTALDDFRRFLAAHPDRVRRAPPSDGYAVGPITFLDLSLANYVGTRVEAVDFAIDYGADLFGGRFELAARATWNRRLEVETLPGQVTDYLGVGGGRESIAGGFGALPWRGNATLRWSRDRLSLGLQSNVFDRYYLRTDRAVVPEQGAAYVPAQAYHTLSAAYTFPRDITLRAVVSNVLDTTPPRDMSVPPLFYSRYGDPLGRSVLLSLTKGL